MGIADELVGCFEEKGERGESGMVDDPRYRVYAQRAFADFFVAVLMGGKGVFGVVLVYWFFVFKGG